MVEAGGIMYTTTGNTIEGGSQALELASGPARSGTSSLRQKVMAEARRQGYEDGQVMGRHESRSIAYRGMFAKLGVSYDEGMHAIQRLGLGGMSVDGLWCTLCCFFGGNCPTCTGDDACSDSVTQSIY